MLTIINTFWTGDKINSKQLKEHLFKFIPRSGVEVLLCIDECNNTTETAQKKIKMIESYKRYGFKVIKLNHNGKAGGCRNAGLDAATGEYVFFIDSWNDSLASGRNFHIIALIEALKNFRKIAPNLDAYELSNKYNNFYRANPWNVFWKRSFIEKHGLRYIEWQGYEDFLFNFVYYSLDATFGIYLEESRELLTYPNYIRYKCPPVLTCYNHAFADTKYSYAINTEERYQIACDYFMKYLKRIPNEFKLEIALNHGGPAAQRIHDGELNGYVVQKSSFFKYLFMNIEKEFKEPKWNHYGDVVNILFTNPNALPIGVTPEGIIIQKPEETNEK